MTAQQMIQDTKEKARAQKWYEAQVSAMASDVPAHLVGGYLWALSKLNGYNDSIAYYNSKDIDQHASEVSAKHAEVLQEG